MRLKLPELSLVFATDKGDFLLSGCAHSSIEAIIRETLRGWCGRIHTVAGGFHLIPCGGQAIAQLALRMRHAAGRRVHGACLVWVALSIASRARV